MAFLGLVHQLEEQVVQEALEVHLEPPEEDQEVQVEGVATCSLLEEVVVEEVGEVVLLIQMASSLLLVEEEGEEEVPLVEVAVVAGVGDSIRLGVVEVEEASLLAEMQPTMWPTK